MSIRNALREWSLEVGGLEGWKVVYGDSGTEGHGAGVTFETDDLGAVFCAWPDGSIELDVDYPGVPDRHVHEALKVASLVDILIVANLFVDRLILTAGHRQPV